MRIVFPKVFSHFYRFLLFVYLHFYVGLVADVAADVAGKNVDMAACASAVALCLKKVGHIQEVKVVLWSFSICALHLLRSFLL